MSNSDNQNWEDQWRKEMDSHAPLPLFEDWHGMSQLLERSSLATADHIIEQEPIGYDPWRSIIKRSPELGWPIWTGLVLFVIALGLWLGLTPEAIVQQEMEVSYEQVDTISSLNFPLNYRVIKYYTHDEDGQRSPERLRDTVVFSQRIVHRAPRTTPAMAALEKRVIDTVYMLDAEGNLHTRYDSGNIKDVSIRTMPTESGKKSLRTNSDQPAIIDRANLPSPVFAPVAPDPVRPTTPQDTSEVRSMFSPPEKVNVPITLGVIVEPLPLKLSPLGAGYWERRANELLENGKLKVKRITIRNGHYPAIRQRF